jgi:hypothetical protein
LEVKKEDYAPFGRVILLGSLTKKKPCSADALLWALLFQPLTNASICRSENNKALVLRIKAFSL